MVGPVPNQRPRNGKNGLPLVKADLTSHGATNASTSTAAAAREHPRRPGAVPPSSTITSTAGHSANA